MSAGRSRYGEEKGGPERALDRERFGGGSFTGAAWGAPPAQSDQSKATSFNPSGKHNLNEPKLKSTPQKAQRGLPRREEFDMAKANGYGVEKGNHPSRQVGREIFTAADRAEFEATVAADPARDPEAMADDEWLRHMMGKHGHGGI